MHAVTVPDHNPLPRPSIAGKERIQQIEEEEKALKEENRRLQRRLLREQERREQMTRQLSESESSIEMDEERCGETPPCKRNSLRTLDVPPPT